MSYINLEKQNEIFGNLFKLTNDVVIYSHDDMINPAVNVLGFTGDVIDCMIHNFLEKHPENSIPGVDDEAIKCIKVIVDNYKSQLKSLANHKYVHTWYKSIENDMKVLLPPERRYTDVNPFQELGYIANRFKAILGANAGWNKVPAFEDDEIKFLINEYLY